jgi:hypothetical protein
LTTLSESPDFDIAEQKAMLTEWLAEECARIPLEDRAFLVEKMIGRADPVMNLWTHKPPEHFIDARAALRYIHGYHIFQGRCGWLDRKGKFYSCAWAAHEKMCRFFGWDEKDLERAGWVRVGAAGRVQFTKRLSKKQISFMKEHKLFHEYEEDADIMPVPTFEFRP